MEITYRFYPSCDPIECSKISYRILPRGLADGGRIYQLCI